MANECGNDLTTLRPNEASSGDVALRAQALAFRGSREYRNAVSRDKPLHDPGLSWLEFQVVNGVARGLSNAEIARRLGLSGVNGPYNVTSIIRRAMGKLQPRMNPPDQPGAPQPPAA